MAKEGKGLEDGIDWLTDMLSQRYEGEEEK